MLLPIALALTTAGTFAAKESDFFIGTYTSANGSQGIYHAKLNTETGAISEPVLSVKSENPSYLTLSHNGHFLYAANEQNDGFLSAYSVGKDLQLTLLNTQPSKGGAPCHVSVDSFGKNLFAANYSGGSVICCPIQADGSLGTSTSFYQNSGMGPNKDRQEGPHLHSIYSIPGTSQVLACDLGTDELLAFDLDAPKGVLSLSKERTHKLNGGSGPRHLAFHPNGKFVYANNEMGNAVTALALDKATGSLTELQTLSSLADGVKVDNTTAEIVCHPSGKWLYVTNRGDDSIAVYAIQSDGKLSLVEIKKLTVKVPRGMDMDPKGHWIVVAGQASNDITSLSIDKSSGKLTESNSKVKLNQAVCIVFTKH